MYASRFIQSIEKFSSLRRCHCYICRPSVPADHWQGIAYKGFRLTSRSWRRHGTCSIRERWVPLRTPFHWFGWGVTPFSSQNRPVATDVSSIWIRVETGYLRHCRLTLFPRPRSPYSKLFVPVPRVCFLLSFFWDCICGFI